jgi:hypothetical protein
MDLISHGKGLWNRQKESVESSGVTSTNSGGDSVTGEVLVLSSASVDDRCGRGDDDHHHSGAVTQDAETQ